MPRPHTYSLRRFANGFTLNVASNGPSKPSLQSNVTRPVPGVPAKRPIPVCATHHAVEALPRPAPRSPSAGLRQPDQDAAERIALLIGQVEESGQAELARGVGWRRCGERDKNLAALQSIKRALTDTTTHEAHAAVAEADIHPAGVPAGGGGVGSGDAVGNVRPGGRPARTRTIGACLK